MRDISLHLLDLSQNSVVAGASLIHLAVKLDDEGLLTITLTDDGRGMDRELVRRVLSPFTTSRTTRNVGLGLPLARENCQKTGGDLTIASEPGKGTTVTMTFFTRHIDCLPLGDLAQTVMSLVMASEEGPDIVFDCEGGGGQYQLDTRMLKEALDPVPLTEPEIFSAIQNDINEGVQPLVGGIVR